MSDKKETSPAPWVYEYAGLMDMFDGKRVVAFELDSDHIDPIWIMKRGAKDLAIVYASSGDFDTQYFNPDLDPEYSEPTFLISSLGYHSAELAEFHPVSALTIVRMLEMMTISDDVMFGCPSADTNLVLPLAKVIQKESEKTYAIKSQSRDLVIWGTDGEKVPISRDHGEYKFFKHESANDIVH